MEEAGNIPSSEGIGQVATINKADKVSKRSKDLTCLTSVNSHKMVHLCGSLGLTAFVPISLWQTVRLLRRAPLPPSHYAQDSCDFCFKQSPDSSKTFLN